MPSMRSKYLKNKPTGTTPAPKIYSEKELKARQAKKTQQVATLAKHMQSLRYNITKDLQSEDEKIFLTALILDVMDKTAERIGNSQSAAVGHRGITGLLKSQAKVEGNRVTFNYTGKSGVKQTKVVTDSRLADNILTAKELSSSRFLFCTSEGFCIKADRVNRYLSDFDITAKDVRGYAANRWLIDKLRSGNIADNEKERKKEFLRVAGIIAKRVGHTKNMLRSSYLLPDLEPQYILHGKIINIRNED